MNTISFALHVLAAVVWVGGMFFAYVVLRPSMAMLEPAQRLPLWAGVFKRFFPWVWMVILVLLISGYGMIFSVWKGFASSPPHVHLMQLLGLLMMALFVWLYYRVYPLFRKAVSAEDWPAAGQALNRIRHIILVNLVLGIIVVLVAASGRFG